MRQLSEAAQAAKQIRKELKAQFPGIKFSVTSENYSGGNSISIGYIDGPTEKEVEAITNKYEYGSFDGMTDMYNNDNIIEGLPQVKYLFVTRSYSEEVCKPVIEKLSNPSQLGHTCRGWERWADMYESDKRSAVIYELREVNFMGGK